MPSSFSINGYSYTSLSQESNTMYCNKCIQILGYLTIPWLFILSIIGWNVSNYNNPKCNFIRYYQVCNSTISVCVPSNIHCETSCMEFLNIFGQHSGIDYISIMIMIYWICFILGWLIFIINDTNPVFSNTQHIIRRAYNYIIIAIPLNTLWHCIGTGITYLINYNVAHNMPIISLYTIYLGFTLVLCVGCICACCMFIIWCIKTYYMHNNSVQVTDAYYVI